MKETFFEFACKLKEDSYKFISDLSTVGIASILTNSENWLLIHGAAFLIFGRIVLLLADAYKRIRDVKKPEWDNIVIPVLKKEAVQNRKKSFWKKLINQIKQLLKW
jgi:hypothetical protein